MKDNIQMPESTLQTQCCHYKDQTKIITKKSSNIEIHKHTFVASEE